MPGHEYLLSYGITGEFGRFRASDKGPYGRGDRVVARTARGTELAVVLCPAGEGHVTLLPGQHIGELLRRAAPTDLHTALARREQGQSLFAAARRLSAAQELPLEIVDAEVLLDGREAVLHHLQWSECDPLPLLDELTRRHGLKVHLHNLALPATCDETDHAHAPCGTGCGSGGCSSGGCDSCSSGGCGDGGCGVAGVIRTVSRTTPDARVSLL